MKIAPINLAVVLIGLSACDPFFEPTIRNGLTSYMEMTVAYADGSSTTSISPPCRVGFIGKRDVKIKYIIIKIDGEIVHNWGSEEMRRLYEIEESFDGSHFWNVTKSEIQFQDYAPPEKCF